MKRLELTGQRFSYLTVVEPRGTKNGHTMWLCRCDCGNEKVISAKHLMSGNIKSCGCMHFKACLTHGKTETRLYHIWCTMKNRCKNPSSPKWYRYGGRGIKVCEEWQRFEPFYKWAIEHGYSDELSIDRINNDGNYEPNNCRWATAKEQANNKSKSTGR